MKSEEAAKTVRQVRRAIRKQVAAPMLIGLPRFKYPESSEDPINGYYCPDCKKWLVDWFYCDRDEINSEGCRNYCPRCGQKLDWRLKH